MEIKPKKLSRLWLLPPAILVLLFILFLTLRGLVLQTALKSIDSRLKEHNYTAHWDGAGFKGIRKLFVKGIYIQSGDSRDEIFVDSLMVKLRLAPLIIKNIRISNLQCRSVSVRYNPDTLVISDNTPVKKDSADFLNNLKEKDLAGIVSKYVHRFYKYVPARTKIGRIESRFYYKNKTTLAGFHNFIMHHGQISCLLVFSGDGTTLEIPLEGKIDKSNKKVEIAVINTGGKLLPIPLLKDKFGMMAGFDTLGFTMGLTERSHHQIDLNGVINFSSFELIGERLSTASIRIDRFNSAFLVHMGKHFMEVDSSTRVNLNRISLYPYLKISIGEALKIDFKIIPVTWNAMDFFVSLPQGMFTSLTGFEAEGTLRYYLDFSANLEDPDSLIFNTKLIADQFKILRYGSDDYRSMNGSFPYQVYEKGKLKTAFVIGTPNADFVRLEQISPFLRAAVMTSEDGSFFYHNGFNPGAFRESMVTNIKEKRFARGGSTISMQLVKNVFLTKNKTVARKIEEALIVWLIENQNLVSKQRMYEVYLNLIEWGPGVYGISQASRFYFDKKPYDLTLQESIFLASIVPRPKWYKYTFESNGEPKPFFANYFRRMEQLMVGKQFISSGDTIGVATLVTITGPAAQAFTATDTLRNDEILLQEMDMIQGIIRQ